MKKEPPPISSTLNYMDQKLNPQVGLLESVLYANGHFPFLSDHLKRLQRGATALNISLPSEFQSFQDADLFLRQFVYDGASGSRMKLRITLEPRPEKGVHTVVDSEEIPDWISTELISVLATPGFNAFPGSLKTTDRKHYSEWLLQAKEAGVSDTLICTPEGSIIETAIGNIICYQEGNYILPEQSSEGIKGIFLTNLLRYFDEEKTPYITRSIRLESIWNMSGVWVVNAVRGPLNVHSVDGKSLSQDDQASKFLADFYWKSIGART